MAVLPNLAQENEALKAMLADMQAKLAEASKPRALALKVTAPKLDPKTNQMVGTTGAISIYGLQKMPITLYRSQWERLIAHIPTIRTFIDDNAHLLASKD